MEQASVNNMEQNPLSDLDTYIQDYIHTQTTRHASEDAINCPPLSMAVAAERTMRITLHEVFDREEKPLYTSSASENAVTQNPDKLCDEYWQGARYVTRAHGAIEGYELNDYFEVSTERAYPHIRAKLIAEYDMESMPRKLLLLLDSYVHHLEIEPHVASRLMTTLVSYHLSDVKKIASDYERQGLNAASACNAAFTSFVATTGLKHIEMLQEAKKNGIAVSSLINKRSSYPQTNYDDTQSYELRMSTSDSKGLAVLYRIQERPYSRDELEGAEKIIGNKAMQYALLKFHLQLVEEARGYLSKHPERLMHSLEPFSEIFVNVNPNGLALVPNPKLIKVIANNVLPALSRIATESGVSLERLTGNHVLAAIALAKQSRVFQAQIGQFNNYDSRSDTVVLASLFSRTCPAMQMFTEALARILPDAYDYYATS